MRVEEKWGRGERTGTLQPTTPKCSGFEQPLIFSHGSGLTGLRRVVLSRPLSGSHRQTAAGLQSPDGWTGLMANVAPWLESGASVLLAPFFHVESHSQGLSM